MSRSLTVQSVLYGNDPRAIIRAVEATATAAAYARDASLLAGWTLAIGDCSEVPVLSADGLREITELTEAAGGRLLHEVFGANLGHGGGHNRLAPMSDSDLLLFLNPDGQLGFDALAALVSTVAADVGAADARQVPLEHPKDYDEVTGDQSWASGACLITRRDLFEEIGGFDHDTFFMYCDDVDYSWRVRLAGRRVVHQPAARVFHDKRLSFDGAIVPSSAEVYYSAEAAVLLAVKYSRPDITERILLDFGRDPNPVYQRVVREFQEREQSNRLPTPLDASRRIAQFTGGNYAKHRY